MSPIVAVRGMAAKDIRNLWRQPSLLVTLLLGPFVLLSVFAVGYDNDESVQLDTIFVGERGDLYEEAITDYADEIERYVSIEGFTDDVVAARAALDAGDVDIVVVFPARPVSTVLSGERAVVTVLHNKIDPLQQAAVEIASQVAVQQLNAQLLEGIVARSQTSLEPLLPRFDQTIALARRLDTAAAEGRIDDVAAFLGPFEESLTSVRRATEATRDVVVELESGSGPGRELDRLLAELDGVEIGVDALRSGVDDPAAVRAQTAGLLEVLEQIRPQAERLVGLDPTVVVRPFDDDSENILRAGVDDTDFFSPSVTALLIQHLVLTLVALSSVRDEAAGLHPLLRVGPTRPIEVIAAKFTAFAVVGAVIAIALVVTQTLGLGVEMRGSWLWLGFGLALAVLASIAVGLAVGGMARSDSQAVQYAMLLLLGGIFFGGFFLDLDAFAQPALAISWILPVTPAISWLQDVVLRGIEPDRRDIALLAAQLIAYGVLGWALLQRRLRVR